MTAILLFVLVLTLGLVPLGCLGVLLLAGPDLQRPDAPDATPTVLRTGSRDVLSALDAGDVAAARRSFLSMTRDCGHCSKLPHNTPTTCMSGTGCR
jgi:hypothetical protein